MEDRRMLHGPARAWSIVLMALLCMVLSGVLLRRPPPAHPQPAPAPPERPLTPEERRAMYRGWPLFEGWPLPQLPPDTSAPGAPPPEEPPRRRDAPP